MSATDSLFSADGPESATGPDFSNEARLIKSGYKRIAGVDEVGRGPLAGPVLAAAVILDPQNIPVGLDDSKKLDEKRREMLFGNILATSNVAWASLPAAQIDVLNIRAAALRAMEIAVANLAITPDAVLIDGRDVPPDLSGIGNALVKGDQRSLSIAAASIVAKVIRDRMMVEADKVHPQYGFASHKGYGSKRHREALLEFGPCALHRRTFSPIREMT